MLCKDYFVALFFVQIINTLGAEKSTMKEELDRINQQLQKHVAEKEGCCHELLFLT